MNKVVLAITGASGSIYANLLLQKLSTLKDQCSEVAIVLSDNAKEVWEMELENQDYNKYGFPIYNKQDFHAPFASGSGKFNTM
ncbi:MAG: flavoprotein, partial [Chitinophagaceae bacterium]